MSDKMKVFLHNHSPFAKDCNVGCGWYEIGPQLTFYSPTLKKTVTFEEAMDDKNFPYKAEQQSIILQAGNDWEK